MKTHKNIPLPALRAVMIALPALLLLCSVGPDTVAGGTTTETTNGVTATVLFPDSTPAADVTVRLRPSNYIAIPSFAGLTKRAAAITDITTDFRGRFFIDSVEPGSYTIEVTDNKSVAARIICEVVPGGDTLDLGAHALAPFARLTGSVALDSNTGAMHAAVYGLERSVAVDSLTGAWSIDDLPQGAHTVRIASSSRDLGAAIIDAPPVAAGASDTLNAVRLLSYSGESYTQWAYSRTITINTSPTGADISEDVHRFPLLVRLDASDFGFSGARADGRDVRFAKADGTPLRYEIEQWDPVAQHAAVWVLMDTVYGNNASQSITMHWGKADAQDFSNGAVVFDTANGFAAVYHFQSAAPLHDATYNANHFRSDLTRAASGAVGDARYFDGADSMAAPDDPTLEPSSPTVSCWFKTDGNQDTVAKIINKGHTSPPYMSYTLELRYDPSIVGFQTAKTDSQYHTLESAQTITDRSWTYICGLFNETTGIGRFFVNGMLNGEFSDPVPIEYYNAGNYPLYAGCQRGASNTFYKGWLDEVRVENRPRSEAWVRLCYESQRHHSRLLAFKK
ncbi:MAG: DUF2341 domain-containing protein [Chitinivibrionales bacterium]|nr:DUF2341 domain-containing protein [Chitinivibrionales bacterium]